MARREKKGWKKDLIEAYKELEKVVGGIDPPINEDLTTESFEKELWDTVDEIVEPSDKFSEKTQGTFDELRKKYENGEDREDGEDEQEEPEEDGEDGEDEQEEVDEVEKPKKKSLKKEKQPEKKKEKKITEPKERRIKVVAKVMKEGKPESVEEWLEMTNKKYGRPNNTQSLKMIRYASDVMDVFGIEHPVEKS